MRMQSKQQPLKKKGKGRGVHICGWISEEIGHLRLSDEQLAAQVTLPEAQRLPITKSCVITYPGKGHDYWWDNDSWMQWFTLLISINTTSCTMRMEDLMWCSRCTDHKPYKPSIKSVTAACVLNNIWPLVYLVLLVIMLPILTYIGCYLQLQWLIAPELSSKELALGVTVIVLELFVSHLILGMFDFAFVLNSANCSFAAQALDRLDRLLYASQTVAAPYGCHSLRNLWLISFLCRD